MNITSPALAALALTLSVATTNSQQWTTNNLPPGLIAWWQAEGNLLDSAGAHHGSAASTPSYALGRYGQGFHFGGTNQSVVVPDVHADLDGWNQFTMEAWVKLDNTIDGDSGAQGIFSKVGDGRQSGADLGYQFGFAQSATKLFCQFNTNGQAWPGFQTIADLGSSAPTNVWLHVAATYDHNAVKLYLNGVSLVTNVIGAATIVDSPSTLRFNGDDNANGFFAGGIDDARFYNRALTEAEIALLALRLALVNVGRSDTNFLFSFQTVSNFSYTVEYNDDLNKTNWLFFQIITGNGSIKQVASPVQGIPQRFFRVRLL